jgi:hypothetical protein
VKLVWCTIRSLNFMAVMDHVWERRKEKGERGKDEG